MAVFAQPTKDENLTPGWNVQNASTNGQTGYAQPGVHGAETGIGQAGAGFPSPAGSVNTSTGQNSASYAESILTNPGYSSAGSSLSASATAPVPTTAGVQQPFGTAAIATVVLPETATSLEVAPFNSGGVADATFTEVWVQAATPAAANVTVTIPPAGFIKLGTGSTGTVTITYSPAL